MEGNKKASGSDHSETHITELLTEFIENLMSIIYKAYIKHLYFKKDKIYTSSGRKSCEISLCDTDCVSLSFSVASSPVSSTSLSSCPQSTKSDEARFRNLRQSCLSSDASDGLKKDKMKKNY